MTAVRAALTPARQRGDTTQPAAATPNRPAAQAPFAPRVSQGTAAFLFALTITMSTTAQETADDKQTAFSKVERKNKAPVNQDVLRVTLPKPFEGDVSNGLHVMILEDHRAPLVQATLTIYGAGELHVPAAGTGVAHLAAQMLLKGTKTKTAQQLAEEIERIGATIHTGANYGGDSTTISVTALADHFEDALKLAGDMLINPAFPEEELAKLKRRELVALEQAKTNPQFLLAGKFSRVLYGDHPAAIESATAESIQAVTREHLVKWHRDRYTPQASVMTVAGDVDTKHIFGRISLLRFAWKRAPIQPIVADPPKAAETSSVHLVHRAGSVQTVVRVGNLALKRSDPDYVALSLLNRILGGDASARLFLKLREEKGYSYGIYSRLASEPFAAPWSAGGSVKGDLTAEAIDDLLAEIRKVAEEKIPAEEIEETKRAAIARFALSLENPAIIMSYHLERRRHGFPPDYWDHYVEQLAAVTADDLQRVGRKYLDASKLQIVAVGDASKVKPMLAKFGDVQVTDPDARVEALAGSK